MVALGSHFIFLSALFWMLLVVVQLYLAVERVLVFTNSPMPKFCLLAYGLPLLIVSTSKLVDSYFFDSHGYQNPN